MNSIDRLIMDRDYLTELLNGPCAPGTEEHVYIPIRREWIDEKATQTVSQALNRLLPDGIPYANYALVESNPDTTLNGACVDVLEKRLRYLIITVIPDTDHPYDMNLPLFHQMRIIALHCWEIIRSVLAANREFARVLIAKDPRPPILNNARIEWVTLYLGRKPYEGFTRLSQQWKRMEEFDGYETDVHLFKLREMPADPLLQRLIDAYDANHPEPVPYENGSVNPSDTEPVGSDA